MARVDHYLVRGARLLGRADAARRLFAASHEVNAHAWALACSHQLEYARFEMNNDRSPIAGAARCADDIAATSDAD